jgi:hypothetical protein
VDRTQERYCLGSLIRFIIRIRIRVTGSGSGSGSPAEGAASDAHKSRILDIDRSAFAMYSTGSERIRDQPGCVKCRKDGDQQSKLARFESQPHHHLGSSDMVVCGFGKRSQRSIRPITKVYVDIDKNPVFLSMSMTMCWQWWGGHYSRNISTPLFGLFLNKEKKNLNRGKRGENGSLTGREQGKETERKGKEKTARRKGESKRETSRKRKGQKG